MHLQDSMRPDVSAHQEKPNMLIPQSCASNKPTDHPAQHFSELSPKLKRQTPVKLILE